MSLARLAPGFAGYDRIAARHLFSELAHLESIAVLAAERGDCVEGQLEDELRHRDTFAGIARANGGLVEPCAEIRELTAYLDGLRGPESMAALNVVAEKWLGTLFEAVAGWGVADELFALIAADEARHVSAAMTGEPPAAVEGIVRELERMLHAIATSAAFMLPLLHFGGPERLCGMADALLTAHEQACAHLRVVPDTHDLRVMCRANRLLARQYPQPVGMTEWDRSKMTLYPHASPMLLWFETPATSGARLQIAVIAALGRILARYPRLRTVTRRGELYRTRRPLVAVRMLHDDRAIMNVVVSHFVTDRAVARQLHRRTRRAQAEAYRAIPPLPDGLDQLIPPSLVACAVNYSGAQGGVRGTGPLSDVEGIPILATVGEPEGGRATVMIAMDHRTHDGQDIGRLCTELKRELQPAKAGFLLSDR